MINYLNVSMSWEEASGWTTYIVSLTDGFDVVDDFKAQCGIKTAGRLIQEKNLGIRDKSACNTKTFLLSTTEPFLDRCADNGVCLSDHTKAAQQIINSSQTLLSRNGSVV